MMVPLIIACRVSSPSPPLCIRYPCSGKMPLVRQRHDHGKNLFALDLRQELKTGLYGSSCVHPLITNTPSFKERPKRVVLATLNCIVNGTYLDERNWLAIVSISLFERSAFHHTMHPRLRCFLVFHL